MLDKRLQLGGLQVGGPRTAQNSARFRVCNNFYQTRDGYFIRRSHGEQYADSSKFSGATKLLGVTRYQNEPFVLGLNSSNAYEFYDITGVPSTGGTVTKAPHSSNLPSPNLGASGELRGFAPQYLEKLGCLFVNLGGTNLIKYDGVQVYRAGVPLPYFACAQYASAGTTFIRVIQHHIDFQGNIVNSGYVQFPCTPSSGSITLRVDKNATDLVSTLSGIVPTARPSYEKFDGSFDEFFFVASGAPTVLAGTSLTFTTGGNHNVQVGAYVVVSASLASAANTGLGFDTLGIALKVLSSTATTVTLSLNNIAALSNAERTWVIGYNANGTEAYWAGVTYGVNYWLSVWTSNVSTGNYVWKQNVPALYNSTSTQNYSFSVATPTSPAAGVDQTLFNLAGNLGDIYDVTSEKAQFDWNKNSTLGSMTTYGDNLLKTDISQTIIELSDTTLGGAFEMTTGSSFVAIGEGNDGIIQSICGSSDFLLVSRQFKNYYVSGTLETANYLVQAIDKTSLGAYSNECSIAIDGKILFVNKQGIWALYSGAKCEEVSFNIQGLFDTFSPSSSFQEESYFDIDNYPIYGDAGIPSDEWIRIRMDVQRNLLFFIIKGETGEGRALVFNLNNGEFYTWSGLINNYLTAANYDFKDAVFINGDYYVTANTGTAFGLFKEKKTGTITPYDGIHKPKLVKTWFCGEEPSYEKKLQQLKFFGLCTSSVKITHFLDWKTDVEIDDGFYQNTNALDFSHKKRLTAANFLSVSVGLETVYDSSLFQIEGMELEYEALQQGMKR